MKKLIYLFLAGIIAVSLSSCDQSLLDTNPSDRVGSGIIFDTPEGAQVALNGIYRAMHTNAWGGPGTGTGWSHENPGYFATPIVKGLHGDDHLMVNQGNGWFFFDYMFWIDPDFTTLVGRQYSQWNFYYTMIAQTNYVIANEYRLIEMGSRGRSVLGQAYALRGFAYMLLYEWFCQGNYAVNRNLPGVPIYTEPTTAETRGQPRGTVADVFVQINSDFAKAIEHFEEAAPQAHISHVDRYATYLLWARAAQIQENWDAALRYATAALEKPGLARVASLGNLGNFNNRNAASVMWAFEVIADQTSPFGPFFTHMDPTAAYGSVFHSIDAWLWSQIPDTDGRKNSWWSDGTLDVFTSGGVRVPQHGQVKFRFADPATSVGDGIFLRAEEAILIAAEANIRKASPDFAAARALLRELGSMRDTNFDARLAARTNSSEWNTDTRGAFTTLMDEVLFQRRIELWGEGLGRAFDLRRLNLGFTRVYEGSNHPSTLTMRPGDYRFTTLIPQVEIDNNESLSVADQNPR